MSADVDLYGRHSHDTGRHDVGWLLDDAGIPLTPQGGAHRAVSPYVPALRDPTGNLLFIGNVVVHESRRATVVTHDDSVVVIRYGNGTFATVVPSTLRKAGLR